MFFSFNDDKQSMVRLEDVSSTSLEVFEQSEMYIDGAPYKIIGQVVHFSNGINNIRIALRSSKILQLEYDENPELASQDYERLKIVLDIADEIGSIS